METKILAMYLPQFHETEENNKFWGKGFTDWVSVKNAEPLFIGHNQPRVPLNNIYYDLTDVRTIRWQADLAKKYGVYGFGIYHYWFSTNQQALVRPAEILLNNRDIDMPFFLAWDNNSWVRTWSKIKHNTNAWTPKVDDTLNKENEDGVLAKLDYGDKSDWEVHFNYLNQFFCDDRYIKIDGKPLFGILNYTDKQRLAKMCKYWNILAKKVGYEGLYLINRLNPYDSMEGFEALYTYEPMFSAWQNENIISRVYTKLSDMFIEQKEIKKFNYDAVWERILNNAKKTKDKKVYFGAFVSYDDSPRRGKKGKIVVGDTPQKFENYMRKLLEISNKSNREYVFLTAWNEWGEGAYLEPDEKNGYAYLEALKRAVKS